MPHHLPAQLRGMQTGCSGKKNRIEYHDITAFPDKTIQTGGFFPMPSIDCTFNSLALASPDYTFLETLSRAADAAKRSLRDYGTVKKEIKNFGRGRQHAPNKVDRKFVLNIPWEARQVLREVSRSTLCWCRASASDLK